MKGLLLHIGLTPFAYLNIFRIGGGAAWDINTYSRIMAGDEESQNQLHVMKDMQVLEENIYLDYPTKEEGNRTQYNKLAKQLKGNDFLYCGNFASLGDGDKEIEEQ